MRTKRMRRSSIRRRGKRSLVLRIAATSDDVKSPRLVSAHGRAVDADPVHCVTTYIPWPIAEDTGLLNPEVGHPYGIHGILEERGHTMARLREEISARMPSTEETRLLHLSPGVPVLDVLHTSIDQDGKPYELTRFVMRADMTGLVYDAPIE